MPEKVVALIYEREAHPYRGVLHLDIVPSNAVDVIVSKGGLKPGSIGVKDLPFDDVYEAVESFARISGLRPLENESGRGYIFDKGIGVSRVFDDGINEIPDREVGFPFFWSPYECEHRGDLVIELDKLAEYALH